MARKVEGRKVFAQACFEEAHLRRNVPGKRLDTEPIRTVARGAQRKTMTIEPKAFRDAMSRFASAVHIVTTDGEAGRRGVTATAVVGVSDEPATLLVCLNASSPQNEFFVANGSLAVNVLAAEAGQTVAEVFAGGAATNATDRFANGDWTTGETGAPLLRDALVAFDCRIVEARRVATHHVLVAEVVGLRLGPDAPPLLYHARGYRLL